MFHLFSLQPNFTAPAPAPVTSQPAVRPFIPSTPPVLRNAEQYQQPTLGSQLYPVCISVSISLFLSTLFS